MRLLNFFVLQQEGTVKPYPNFNAEQDAEVLRSAMKGLGRFLPSKGLFHIVCVIFEGVSLRSLYMSCVMRKLAFCICKNKDADQLWVSRTADQHLCFCYIDSTIPLLPKSEISSL